MSNDEIMQTIAEFMGWTDVEAVPDKAGGHFCWIGIHPTLKLDGKITVDDYLESYDALAAVWNKLHETDPLLWMKAMTSKEVATHWFSATTKKHAKAIAKAIKNQAE